MALDHNILGQALYNTTLKYNEKTMQQLGGNIENVRLNFWKDVAKEVIDHIKINGEGKYQGGLMAGSTAVSAPGNGTVIKLQ